MVLATTNKPQRLLFVSYAGRVEPGEFDRGWDELKALIAELQPGYRVLVDTTNLEFMDPECATEVGRVMELLDKSGIGLIIRVMPDESKDIGMNILTIFHFKRKPRIINCQNLAEAIKKLSLFP